MKYLTSKNIKCRLYKYQSRNHQSVNYSEQVVRFFMFYVSIIFQKKLASISIFYYSNNNISRAINEIFQAYMIHFIKQCYAIILICLQLNVQILLKSLFNISRSHRMASNYLWTWENILLLLGGGGGAKEN